MLGVKGVICRMLSLIFGSSNTDALGCDRSGQPQTQGISILRPGKPIVSVMLHITPLRDWNTLLWWWLIGRQRLVQILYIALTLDINREGQNWAASPERHIIISFNVTLDSLQWLTPVLAGSVARRNVAPSNKGHFLSSSKETGLCF